MGKLYPADAFGLSNVKTNIDLGYSFSLVYGIEAVVPIETMVPSAWLALTSKVTDPRERIHDVEGCREKKIKGWGLMVDLPKEDQ